jgi:GNAT superfamily N-acetyltransferase
MMQDIAIADARPEDGVALSTLAFRSKAHWGYDATFMEACREELSVPPNAFEGETIRIAKKGNMIAGFYRLVLDGNEAELEAMFIEPSFIGSGVGKALWNDMIVCTAEVRARRLTCQADPYAEGFYRHMGMERIGKRPSESIPGRFLPLMELRLA